MNSLLVRHSVFSIGLVTVLCVVSSCEKAPEVATEKQSVTRLVRVQVADTERVEPTLTFAGEVKARYESHPGFLVAGKITERLVGVGDTIRAGQVLARLDDADQVLEVEASRAMLSQAKSELSLAKQDFERYSRLHERGAVSQAEFDRYATAKERATLAVAAAGAQWDKSRNQLAYTELVSDHSGTVSAVLLDVDQVVAAGVPVFDMERTGENEIEVSVPEQQRHLVTAVNNIDITLWALPEDTYQGNLRAIAPSTDPVTRTYTARIGIKSQDENIRPGMTARVSFSGSGGDAIVIPMSALYTKTDRPHVWRVDTSDNTVSSVNVVTGALVGNGVSIDSGIDVGDTIVTAGANLLIEGQKVRPMEQN